MSRALVDEICSGLPGAEFASPADGALESWKVGGKMFACLVTDDNGVSVKTASVETAQMLIDAGVGRKAPYFHGSWIRIDMGGDTEELRHRIGVSYDIVRSSLTKKVQATLG